MESEENIRAQNTILMTAHELNGLELVLDLTLMEKESKIGITYNPEDTKFTEKDIQEYVYSFLEDCVNEMTEEEK